MEMQIIKEQELLGKHFTIYGTYENPLFLAKDVANWIEHSNGRMMLKSVDDEEKLCVNNPYALKGQQEQWFLTEDGLYEVLMQSRKPIAKQFKRKVKQILRQIRKTGGYIPVSQEDDEKTILAKAVGIYQRTVAEKDTIIAALKPKADEYDAFMNSHGNYSVNAVANIIGYGEYKFFAMLREMKILRYEQGDNVPYGRFRKSGHFIEVATTDPRGYNHTTTYVTPKGLSYLSKKFSQTTTKGTVA